MLIESDNCTSTFLVSLPVTTKLFANFPVTKQEPEGIGEVVAIGFGTVVAPAGVCPEAE